MLSNLLGGILMEENIITQNIPEVESNKKEGLWTKNFFLIWQGQFVSSLGDVAYEIALGFWVLAVTGSTGLMGTIMAASVLPRVIISPFAGVLVDRTDRKKMLVLMDIIRGVFIVFVGIAALAGFIKVWMAFGAGVILGICGAFFNPAISSSIPDISPKSQIVKANSAFSAINALSNILGNSVGGFLFNLLGAPVMFLFNGLSYIFSGLSIMLTKIPSIHKESEPQHFSEDLREGFKFVWYFRGLRYLIFIACLINFFCNMGLVLFLPYFQKSPALGPAKYGIAAALLTGGMLAGMVFTSVVNISPKKRLRLFMIFCAISFISFSLFAFTNNFYLVLLLLFAAGFGNAIINVFISSTMQQSVPQDKRGKVFGLTGTMFQGLTPIAMALGGILAEFFPIKWIFFFCFSVSLIICVPFAFNYSFKRFINFDPEKETVEEIM
jgi:MFS family permease